MAFGGICRRAEAAGRGRSSVAFLGEVDEEMLEQLYGNCYAYVLPSEVEGMSLSLLDGMAFGACVICSDIAPNLAIGDAGLSFRVLDTATCVAAWRRSWRTPTVPSGCASALASAWRGLASGSRREAVGCPLPGGGGLASR
ncbi:glycosyltransferase [Sphingomonas sp. MMS24-JH45]